MKFSEAMMLGSLAIKAIPYARCRREPEDPISGCALGMAEFSIGRYGTMCAAEKEWKWLNAPYDGSLFPCGCCLPTVRPTYTTVIAQMFNRHVMGKGDWTLEKLADYVRSIEPAEPVISILPSRKPLVRIPEGSDQGDEQPEWDDMDTSRELYSGIQRGCQ